MKCSGRKMPRFEPDRVRCVPFGSIAYGINIFLGSFPSIIAA